jgi:thioredoxin 1
MSTVKHTSEQTFEHDVLQSPIPVLIDFYADWCGPCRMLAPLLERVAREFAGRAKIVKVNVDEEPGLAEQYRVESIPTLVFMLDGQVAGRAAGLVSEAGLRQALDRLVGASTVA